ncbi:MAG: SWIM zinc finger family protein [Ignavibacteria bacterium]
MGKSGWSLGRSCNCNCIRFKQSYLCRHIWV